MTDFVNAIMDPHISFLRYAVIAGLLSSISFGIAGTYVVVKRISYIAGAISHSVLGGIGIALYLERALGITWCTPMAGATVAAVVSAIIIGLVKIFSGEREDSVIGAIWVLGMATGILFMAKTPGYIDPMSYLFGNILMITKQDLWLIFTLDIMILGAGIIFYNKLLALCFDEEFLKLRGIKTKVYYILLLCVIALTIVLLIRIVGIVMVIALLTLPAATSGKLSKNLWLMMVYSTLLCGFYIVGGIAISYSADLPTGGTIVAIAGVVYLLLIVFKPMTFRKKK